LIARERNEVSPAVRLHRYASHLVVYQAEDQGILVVRELHGRQHWEAALA